MRILMVNTVPTERNGITNVIFNLLRGMDGKALTVDLVAIGEPEADYRQQIESRGGQVFVLNRSLKGVFSYIRSLSRVVRDGKYDVVHAHGNSATLFFEMAAARLGGCRMRVAHSHNTTCKFMTLHRLLNPFFQRCCTHALACGEAAGKWLYGNREFTVVNNGVDVSRLRFDPEVRAQCRQELGLSESYVIGHTGQMETVKNHAYLISLFPEILKVRPEAKLMLIGDGSLRPEIEGQIKALGLEEKVLLLGKRGDVPRLYQCMDVFAMPSLFEGLPLSLVEAQAAGLPCVVSDAVTRQVDLVGNMVFVGIGEENRPDWVKALCGAPQADRASFAGRIESSGFDIKSCAGAVLKLYGLSERSSGEK